MQTHTNMNYPTDIWKLQGHSEGFNWPSCSSFISYQEAVPTGSKYELGLIHVYDWSAALFRTGW